MPWRASRSRASSVRWSPQAERPRTTGYHSVITRDLSNWTHTSQATTDYLCTCEATLANRRKAGGSALVGHVERCCGEERIEGAQPDAWCAVQHHRRREPGCGQRELPVRVREGCNHKEPVRNIARNYKRRQNVRRLNLPSFLKASMTSSAIPGTDMSSASCWTEISRSPS